MLAGVLEYGVILDIMDHHDMCFLNCVPNFVTLARLEVCQEPPILEVQTGVLEDGVIFHFIDHLDRP